MKEKKERMKEKNERKTCQKDSLPGVCLFNIEPYCCILALTAKEKKHYASERKKSRKKKLSYETTMQRIRRKRTLFIVRRNSKQRKRFCGRLSRLY